jgi:molecular chaperone GrpE
LNEKEKQEEILPEEPAAEVEEPAAGETPAAEEKPEKKEDELEELRRRKYDALNDRYLRTLAEYDNFRKRSQREKEAVYPSAVAGTVEKFLPVVDSFERALAFECADAEFKKGIVMIYDSLLATLKDLKVEEIGAAGDPFDANLHNAVMHVEDDSLGENVVSAVLQKGYRIGDRVIRYAMVTVAN